LGKIVQFLVIQMEQFEFLKYRNLMLRTQQLNILQGT